VFPTGVQKPGLFAQLFWSVNISFLYTSCQIRGSALSSADPPLIQRYLDGDCPGAARTGVHQLINYRKPRRVVSAWQNGGSGETRRVIGECLNVEAGTDESSEFPWLRDPRATFSRPVGVVDEIGSRPVRVRHESFPIGVSTLGGRLPMAEPPCRIPFRSSRRNSMARLKPSDSPAVIPVNTRYNAESSPI